MPQRYLRQILPSARRIREEGAVRLFGRVLQNPNLWHLNRHSVATAVAIGLFAAFIPVPIQMILAAAGAVAFGCNLPVSVVVVWISNPITMAPLFFAAYKFGAWLLGQTPKSVHFEMSMEWLLTKLVDIWQPFLLGCFALAIATAVVGYVTVQIIWRIHVTQSWNERGARRHAVKSLVQPVPASVTAERKLNRAQRAKDEKKVAIL